jgi:hypothetical protein
MVRNMKFTHSKPFLITFTFFMFFITYQECSAQQGASTKIQLKTVQNAVIRYINASGLDTDWEIVISNKTVNLPEYFKNLDRNDIVFMELQKNTKPAWQIKVDVYPQKDYFAVKATSAKSPFKKGLSYEEYWGDSGKLKRTGQYSDAGLPTGMWTSFYPDGETQSSIEKHNEFGSVYFEEQYFEDGSPKFYGNKTEAYEKFYHGGVLRERLSSQRSFSGLKTTEYSKIITYFAPGGDMLLTENYIGDKVAFAQETEKCSYFRAKLFSSLD